METRRRERRRSNAMVTGNWVFNNRSREVYKGCSVANTINMGVCSWRKKGRYAGYEFARVVLAIKHEEKGNTNWCDQFMSKIVHDITIPIESCHTSYRRVRCIDLTMQIWQLQDYVYYLVDIRSSFVACVYNLRLNIDATCLDFLHYISWFSSNE